MSIPGWSGRWRRLGSGAGVVPGLADLIATAGLATDDPHEESDQPGLGPGPVAAHEWEPLPGSCPWDRSRVVLPAVPPELTGPVVHREVQVEQGEEQRARRLAGIDLGIASRHSVRVLEDDGRPVCRASCVPSAQSLAAVERAALAGAGEGTRLVGRCLTVVSRASILSKPGLDWQTGTVAPEPDQRWGNFSGGIGPDGRMRPMSYEILAGLASEWAELLPETMLIDGPAELLRMARSQFRLSWFDYELMVTATLTGFQALEAAFRVLYPEAEKAPFRALIRRAHREGILSDSIADLADSGAELRNSFSHPLTQTALTLGMIVPMLENTHRLVALVMDAAAVRDAAWRMTAAVGSEVPTP